MYSHLYLEISEELKKFISNGKGDLEILLGSKIPSSRLVGEAGRAK